MTDVGTPHCPPFVVDLDDVRLHTVQLRPQAPHAVLFVHGWGSDHRVWTAVLERTAEDLRCLLVDLRGHGRSTVARTPHTIGRMAGDLAAVAERLGLPDAVVIGHSMGGNVAVELAIRRPDLVRGVVCVDPAYGDPAWADAPTRATAILEQGSQAAAAGIHAAFGPRAGQEQVAAAAATLTSTPPRVLVEALNSTYTDPDAFGHLDDTRRRLRELNVPLLSIYPRADAAERARYLPVAQTVATAPGSGHFIPVEQPAHLWSMIRRWLAAPHLFGGS